MPGVPVNRSRPGRRPRPRFPLAIRPHAPVRVAALTRLSRPSARDQLRVENSPEATMRHGDNVRPTRRVTDQPVDGIVRAAHRRMLCASRDAITPLHVAEDVPYLDGKLERNPSRWLEPNLTQQRRDLDDTPVRQAVRRRDCTRKVARRDERRVANEAVELDCRFVSVEDSGRVVCILVRAHVRPAEPTPVVDVRRAAMTNQMDAHCSGLGRDAAP